MDYRLLRLDDEGLVDRVMTINLRDDELALAWGRMLGCGCAVEVWRGADCLATLVPQAGYYGNLPEAEVQQSNRDDLGD